MTRKGRKLPAKSRSQKDTAGKQSLRSGDGTWRAVARRRLAKWLYWIPAFGVLALAIAAGLTFQYLSDAARNPATGETASKSLAAASFVGSDSCATCHRTEAELWRGSQHHHAMSHASDKTVLGDFANAQVEYFGVRSRFFRKNGKFLVETDGPDGKLATFEIKYTFGIDPLQQYLVAFPDGRIQALSLAWDSRPKETGGQRWFHLYPQEAIRHDDILHWTKLNQNWNFMCAECHSTGISKNYDAARDRFATTWSEISVGCEACHGRGSEHVRWAEAGQSWRPLRQLFGQQDDPTKGLIVQFDERAGVSWTLDASTGAPHRSAAPAALRKEVETCGLCHARRGQISEDWIPGQWLSDTHSVTPIGRDLYHADGQMLGEVYNYGSFKQSRMFAAGVTCSDCHDPHSAQLRASGDGTCLRCHAADKYAAVQHHRHAAANPPLACASCHMPARTYMVVDRRHDHSFRIPRPDLSAALGTPNACNDCHTDKPPAWAAAAIEAWHGPQRKGFQTYAPAFQAAWSGQPDAATLLAAVAANGKAPAIARASALAELADYVSPVTIELARNALADPDPVVRIGALDMLDGALRSRIGSPAQLWQLASPLLADPSRGVRIRTVALLAATPAPNLPPSDHTAFEQAAAEFIAAQRLNADRPEARTALGSFFASRGDPVAAEIEFRAALRLSPQYTAAAINLADLYRELGRDKDGEIVLRNAAALAPQDGGLHHALGLTLVRLKRLDEALSELAQASALEPDRPRYAYVYAIALHTAGRVDDALAVLKEALPRRPDDPDMLVALIGFSRDAGDNAAALGYAERLARIAPADPGLAALMRELRGPVPATPQPNSP
ncbi:tetratricopeptide repeat protein [Dongia soli]|uniref:Tetratricopeptide repeat protein n=1 Tax=Dongia soli TaxID=600628 RepID=A0ABU5EEQ0_9PROT|nr:tetratricopeptide repeat protein [Dongia soli]MDY0884667.1 tetratricopeptide repeat protein [Dongia soli]